MEYVEAFKDSKQINSIKKYLKKHSERDYVLFVFGINTGLKISEMLTIKVKDVIDINGRIKDFLIIHSDELHTKKEIFLNNKVKKALVDYITSKKLNSEDFLFQSSKTKRPISRQQAYRVLNKAAEAIGIKSKVGTNSLRKTFGYHAYKKGVAISLIQKHFNHATPSETLRFLGISKTDEIKTKIDVNL